MRVWCTEAGSRCFSGLGEGGWPGLGKLGPAILGDSLPRPSFLASTRLAVLSSSLTHWKKPPPLPSLTSQPHQVLASEPIPFSDLQQVSLQPLCLPLPRCLRRWGG